MIKNSKVYDVLKYISFVFYPALVVFVGVVLNAINYEYTEIVLTIMAGFETFLGSILGYSNVQYKKQMQNNVEGE